MKKIFCLLLSVICLAACVDDDYPENEFENGDSVVISTDLIYGDWFWYDEEYGLSAIELGFRDSLFWFATYINPTTDMEKDGDTKHSLYSVDVEKNLVRLDQYFHGFPDLTLVDADDYKLVFKWATIINYTYYDFVNAFYKIIDTYYVWEGETVTADLSGFGFEAVEYLPVTPNIATVDESGTITVKQTGTTFIIAKDSEGNKVAIRLEAGTSKVVEYASSVRDYYYFFDIDEKYGTPEIYINAVVLEDNNAEYFNDTIVSYVYRDPWWDKSASSIRFDTPQDTRGAIHMLVQYQSRQAYLNDTKYMSSNYHHVEYEGRLYFCDNENFESSEFYIYPFEIDGVNCVSYGKPGYISYDLSYIVNALYKVVDTYYVWEGETVTVDLSNIGFKAVEYISANPYIAIVDESGTITVKQTGTTFIIAKDSEGNKVAIRLEVETSKVENYVSMIRYNHQDDFKDADADEVYEEIIVNMTNCSDGQHSNETIVSYVHKNPIEDRSASFVQLDFPSNDYGGHGDMVHILVKYQSKQAYLNDIDYMSSNYHSVEYNGNLYFCEKDNFESSNYYIYPFEDDGIYYVSYGKPNYFYTTANILPVGVELIDTYYAWMGESVTVDLSNIDFKAVEYISVNPYIATVDESGTIIVKQTGTTFIIAKDSEGNKVAIRLEAETSKVENYVSMIRYNHQDDFKDADADEVYKSVANITDFWGEHSNETIVSYVYKNPIKDRSASFIQFDFPDYDNSSLVRILVKYQSKQAYLNDIDYLSSNYQSVEYNGNLYFCDKDNFRFSNYYIYPFEDNGIYYIYYGEPDCFYTNADISPIR